MVGFCREKRIDLVIVGPEQPLVEGLVDSLTLAGVPAFGPTAAAAALEGSKAFMKGLCRKNGIPTAAYETFTDADRAKAFVREHGAPIVVKTSGLAAGEQALCCALLCAALCAVLGSVLCCALLCSVPRYVLCCLCCAVLCCALLRLPACRMHFAAGGAWPRLLPHEALCHPSHPSPLPRCRSPSTDTPRPPTCQAKA